MGNKVLRGYRGGVVHSRVLRDLHSAEKTRIVGILLNDLSRWSMSGAEEQKSGSLDIWIDSSAAYKMLEPLFEDTELIGWVVTCFTKAAQELGGYRFPLRQWSVSVFAVSPPVVPKPESRPVTDVFTHVIRRDISLVAQPLEPNIMRQIEAAMKKAEGDRKGHEFPVIPSCLSCNGDISIAGGNISFFPSAPEVSDPFSPNSLVAVFHNDCMPEDAHYSICLEKVTSLNDALYWSNHFLRESWFQESNWATLMAAMFQIKTPGLQEE